MTFVSASRSAFSTEALCVANWMRCVLVASVLWLWDLQNLVTAR